MRVLSVLGATSVVMGSGVSSNESPIRKIINLLDDMVKQLQLEKEDDDAVYAKLSCWCKKNNGEQTAIREKAVADFDAAVASAKEAFAAMQALEEKRNKEFTAKSAKSKEESTFRETCLSEAKEFNARDIELKETAKAAGTAITILKGGQSLLQTKRPEVDAIMQKLLKSSVVNSLATLKPEMIVTLESYFDNRDVSSFLQQPVGYASYSSQSSGVVGMLSQMKEDLEAQISEGGKAEAERRATCKSKLAALNKEVAALGESIDAKEKRIGELAADNADAKAAADEANTTRLNAQEFLAKLTAQCNEADEQYASRTASRTEEIKACNETIEILDNDASFKALGKNAAAPAFLQLRRDSIKRENGASLAMFAIESVSKKNARVMLIQSLIRSAMQTNTKAGVFDSVIKAIDELVGELKAEQAQEVSDRDNCIETENSLKRDVDDTKFHLNTAQETSEELAAKIKMLTTEIEEHAAVKAEIEAQVAEATKIREEGAKSFSVEANDQKETQAILNKAIERMSQVYKGLLQQPGADVIEFGATSTTPGSAPAAFTKSGATQQNEGGNKVVGLLTTVLKDSEAALAKAEQAENDAIAQYEEFMRVSTRDSKAASEAIATKSQRRVNAEAGKENADKDAASLQTKLTSLIEEVLKTQDSCAFLINNFTLRQQKRIEEMESLKTAKQYLQGMN